MKTLRAAALLFLVFSQYCAWAQNAEERRVLLLHLSLSDPSLNGQPPVVTAGDDPVHWQYTPLRDEEKDLPQRIFVRVFQGSKAYLIKNMHKFVKQGCVDYSPALLNVSTHGYKLSFWGLNRQWFHSTEPEILTLVFESADTGGPSSLRLSPDKASIENYFNSGVEIKLMPPNGFQPTVQVTSPPVPAPPAGHQAPPIVLPPCHVVQNYKKGLAMVSTPGLVMADSTIMKEVPCGL